MGLGMNADGDKFDGDGDKYPSPCSSLVVIKARQCSYMIHFKSAK